MARWMVALLVSLALAPAIARADDETTGATTSRDDVSEDVSNDPNDPGSVDPGSVDPSRDSLEIARRPRVRVTFAEPGTVLAPLLAELAGLGAEVERDEASTVSASSLPSERPPSLAREVLDGWVRVVTPGPTRFVVEVWLVAPTSATDAAGPITTFEHVATIEADDEAPASVALRSVELLRAALVGARAFRRAPVAQAPSEPASPPAPREPASSTHASLDTVGTNLGATIGAGLGASPGGGILPLAELGLSLRLRAPIELALTGGIPLAESRTRVDEGRVDVRVAPLDVSLRFVPRFGLVGLTLGAALGVTVTRVVGSTTDEALLGRSRRATVATFAGIVGGSVSLGEALELVAQLRVGRFFSALDVRVGERTVRTWAAWMQATLGLRVRLTGGTR